MKFVDDDDDDELLSKRQIRLCMLVYDSDHVVNTAHFRKFQLFFLNFKRLDKCT